MPGLALTFDDGPDAVWTPRLLALLERLGARATFFPIAARAARAPALVRSILASGHAIGVHCHEHVRHTERDRRWLAADTDRALATLRELGAEPRLWRTPWGVTAPFTDAVASERGLRLVGWTLDTHDWRGDNAEAMLGATTAGLRPGAIVLAHDAVGPGARRSDPAQTVRYVELVAARARAAGMALEALT